MRRSKAPSMQNKAKRICKESDLESHGSEPEDDQCNWGSKDHNGAENVFKRVFNVVWRDVSTKKHKTWKGDGTLEVNVNTSKAIMKDETGKYLGCSTKFNIHDLEPDFQMMVGGKEIEIQNEIKGAEEIYEFRKRQMKNRNWGAEEYISPEKQAEEERKPKGGFKFKPVLVLKQPDLPKTTEIIFKKAENHANDCWGTKIYNTSTENNDNLGTKNSKLNFPTKPNLTSDSYHIQNPLVKSHLNMNRHKEFICFVKPSELQQFLFQQVLDYYKSIKQNIDLHKLQSLDFKHVLLQICNHPSFINHKSTTNELIRHLIPSLPEWSEMGPFDSGKLEFVQYFLNACSKATLENCVVVSKHTNALNMLQGLCDFMDIKCYRLNTNDSEETNIPIIQEFNSKKNTLQIMLINSMETLRNLTPPLQCIKFIIFEEVFENMKILETFENPQHFIVYYLITAFTIEEILLLDACNTNANSENLLELMEELCNLLYTEDICCYLHTKIECQCFENIQGSMDYNQSTKFLKNWQHFANPFDEQILKISCLENSAENIVTIFYKSHN